MNSSNLPNVLYIFYFLFINTATSHLSDRGFASPVVPPPEPEPVKNDKKTIIPKKEDDKEVKGKEDKGEKGENGGNGDDPTAKEKKEKKEKQDEDKSKKEELKKEIKSTPSSNHVSPPPPSEPKQYILHRDIFYLRESHLIKKRQEKETQILLKQFPSVPKAPL